VTISGKPRARMSDVAALAGVSMKTVSRVVNDEPKVSESVRGRVLKAIDQLDYRPNWAAGNLRRRVGRARVLAVLLQDVGNSFSSGLLRALEDACRERQIALLAASLDEEPERERLLVADLVSRRVDGLVIMPATDRQEYLDAELRAGLPTVFVDRRPHGIDADSVTVDNVRGGYDAAAHLLARGHRRIAVLSDLESIETARDRIQGVRRALDEHGVDLDAKLIRPDIRTVDQAETLVTELLRGNEPPTGLLGLRNILSIGALRALRETGSRDRVALVGFDDFPTADLMDLTVVRQDVARIGHEAAALVLSRLDGDDRPPQHIVVQHRLVERGSGEIPPR
jgi:LacI family transcriptional regulator, galactose operon repressor